jgi:hypothetical protein
MNTDFLRRVLRERIDDIAAELRESKRRERKWIHDRDADGTIHFRFFANGHEPKEAAALAADHIRELLEATADELAEKTAQENAVLIDSLVDASAERDRVLSSPIVASAINITTQIESGFLLHGWNYLAPPMKRQEWPKDIDHNIIAEWARGWFNRSRYLTTEMEGCDLLNQQDPLGDRLVATSKRNDFMPHPVIWHPKTGKEWHIHPTSLAWIYVAAKAPHLAAVALLDEVKGSDETAHSTYAIGDLRAEIERRLPAVNDALRFPMTPREIVQAGEALDTRLADYLETIGDVGEQTAKKLRSTKTDPEKWLDPRTVPRRLARALWDGVVRANVERRSTRPDCAGLVMPALNAWAAASHRKAQLELGGQRAVVLDRRGQKVGTVEMNGPQIQGRHIELSVLGNLSTQRLVRWALWAGYEAKWIRQEPEPHRIIIEGGYSRLAEHIGEGSSNRTGHNIRLAVEALSALHVDIPAGKGKLFAHFETRQARGRPARLEIHLLGPFAPDFICRELAEFRSTKPTDKMLVPVPMPQRLPPLVGRDNEKAGQATLQLLALRELRINAEELLEQGRVVIERKKWLDLMDESGVPASLLDAILDVYPRGDGTRPAFLTREGWAFNLADEYSVERRSIIAGAERQAEGRKRQKRTRKARKNPHHFPT